MDTDLDRIILGLSLAALLPVSLEKRNAKASHVQRNKLPTFKATKRSSTNAQIKIDTSSLLTSALLSQDACVLDVSYVHVGACLPMEC